jgi:hypothetical protein
MTVWSIKDKMEELDNSVKDNENILGKYKWTLLDIGDIIKIINLWVTGIEERKEVQVKG